MCFKQFGEMLENNLDNTFSISENSGIFYEKCLDKLSNKILKVDISLKKFKNMEVIYENSSNLC